MENCVGTLQEFCVKSGYPNPVYEVVDESGMDHQKTFVMRCRVGRIEDRGTDSSKKKAKTEAAQKVLEKLKTASGGEVNEEMFVSNGLAPQVGSLTIKDEDRELLEKMERYTNIKLDVLTPEASDKVANFYKGLKHGPTISQLTEATLLERRSDYKKILSEIDEENKIGVNYEEVDFMTDEGESQCLVRLGSLPATIVYGADPDMEKAKQKAARAALNYIALMCKAVNQS